MDGITESQSEYHSSPASAASVQAYVALGSNMGDRARNMSAAIDRIEGLPGVRVAKVSSFFETEPVSGPPQGMYLNAVIEIECALSPYQLLDELQRIESELGRERQGKDFPRTIDLDILLFGNTVIDERQIEIPHPRMHERAFVLDPLHEIAPEAVHPVLRMTVSKMRQIHREAQAAPTGRE